MRIVYLTFEYMDFQTGKIFDGGFANYTHKISQAMSERGHEVFVVKCNRSEAPKGTPSISERQVGKVHAFEVYNGVRFKDSKHKFFLIKENWKFYIWKLLPNFIKKRLPKTLHKKNGVESVLSYINTKKIDMVQTPATIDYFLVPNNMPKCARIVSHPSQWVSSYNMEFTEADFKAYQELYNSIDFLFGPSKKIIEDLKKDFHLNKDITCIETLYDTIQINRDPSLYENLKNTINNKPYLLFYGSLGVLKGTYDIAEIIYNVLDKYQDLHFVFVGKEMSFDKQTPPLQYLLEKAGKYADRIIHYPSQPKTTLYPLIENARGIVLPSRTDNFPNTCVESMRLKKAIVGTVEGSFAQLLNDNESGFICMGNNPKSLQDAIYRLMDSSDEKLKEIGEKAFIRSEDLAPNKIAEQLEQYYKKIIESWRK